MDSIEVLGKNMAYGYVNHGPWLNIMTICLGTLGKAIRIIIKQYYFILLTLLYAELS